MCGPNLRYKAISIAGGTLLFTGSNRSVSNQSVTADGNFNMVISDIRNGSVHKLIVTKSIPENVSVSTAPEDMVFGNGYGATIVLTGETDTKYELEITHDGNSNCIRVIQTASVDSSSLLNKSVDIVHSVTVDDAYTVSAADNGKMLRFTDDLPITLNLPNNLLQGFNIGILQDGAGQISFIAAEGATVQNRQLYFKTAGQRSIASLVVISNSATNNAVYNLSGDLTV